MRIKDSVNAYLAMKAILIAARTHTAGGPIRAIAVPGLGCGVGKLDPNSSALQMRKAYDEMVSGLSTPPASFAEAQKRHIQLNTNVKLF